VHLDSESIIGSKLRWRVVVKEDYFLRKPIADVSNKTGDIDSFTRGPVMFV